MVSRTGRFAASVLSAAAFFVAVSSRADAQTISVQSTSAQIGFTGGVSIDPEQGFVGVFWRSPEIGGRFHLRPGIDGGFGSNLRIATINIDFIARFPIGASGWDFIQGGGPTISLTRFDTSGGDESELGAGGSYIFGFGHDSGFLTEFRVGGGNVPSLKLTAGYALGF
jgi:hypothetical protein